MHQIQQCRAYFFIKEKYNYKNSITKKLFDYIL